MRRTAESKLPDLLAGIYRHYKGPHYEVSGYGHDANYAGRNTVDYMGLELDDAHLGPRRAHRTAVSDDPDVDAFWDFVHEDGSKCLHGDVDGVCADEHSIQPRFEYAGPAWAGR